MQKTQEKAWYEDESFWKTFAPTMFNQERLDVTAEEIDQIIELLDIEKGAKILGKHRLDQTSGFKSYVQRNTVKNQNQTLAEIERCIGEILPEDNIEKNYTGYDSPAKP